MKKNNNRIKARIIVLTGASGVGKTSSINGLISRLAKDSYEFYKFDSIKVPKVKEMIEKYGSTTEWQRIKTYEWISLIVKKSQTKTIIFEGQMNIDFIIEGFKNENFDNYRIVLLDCSEKEMKRRLIQERKQAELANEDMSNWLIYLRNQAIKRNIEIIDTSKLTKEKTLDILTTIIE